VCEQTGLRGASRRSKLRDDLDDRRHTSDGARDNRQKLLFAWRHRDRPPAARDMLLDEVEHQFAAGVAGRRAERRQPRQLGGARLRRRIVGTEGSEESFRAGLDDRDGVGLATLTC
jgi:hypothetical protein